MCGAENGKGKIQPEPWEEAPDRVFLFTLICDVTEKKAAAQKPRRLWIDCCGGRGEDPVPWKCSRHGDLDVVGRCHL